MKERKRCKECPWVVRNRNNDAFIGHAKQHNKMHGCHMLPEDERGPVWSPNEGCECIGALDKLKKDESN